MTRNGKIACLPSPLRDELNRRLAHNEDGATLLDWLNAAPDVKAVLARDFAGEPITKQNLYEWRHGGCVVICVPASLPLNQNLATSCPPEMRPMVPQPGFGSNQVKPNPLNSVFGKTK